MEDTTYNGWKNRKTWLLAMWFDNDEFLTKNLQNKIENWKAADIPLEEAKRMLVEFFKAYMERSLEGATRNDKVLADMLVGFADDIDYERVAESKLEDYEEEDE